MEKEAWGDGWRWRAYDQQHEVLKNLREVAVAWDSNSAVYEGADECPDKTRYGLRPATQQLQTEGHAVDIGAIVRDNAESQNDKTKLAEAAKGWEKHGCQESADAGLIVAVCVAGVDWVEGRCCNS